MCVWVRIVVCVRFGMCDSCVWLGLWRCVPCISLSGCLSSVIAAYISLNSLILPPTPLVEIHHTLVGGHHKYFFLLYTVLFFPSSTLFFSVCLSFLTACLDLTFGFVSFDDFWIVSKSSQWESLLPLPLPLTLPFGLSGCSFCFHT